MSSSPPSPRPVRLPWLQLALRALTALVAVMAIIIAIVVSASRHRTWYTVFVSAFVALFIDTAETIALASRYVGKLRDPVPRIHPVILIALDFCALCMLIWSFFALFLDAWGPHKNTSLKPYNASPFNIVETWFAVAIGAIHAILLVFDCVDCCSIRESASPVYEYEPRPRPRPRQRATTRSRDDLFDMDW
ncbi:uncharacterized protein LY89DRAFT_330528 [Mollisia scopiformis]|uniref:MARVEL domain-containing protein n=1 Tax=Mollisia scopiformis TaxID=149040 RepID=A0A132B7R6_MOLSC|nr:uncharacterized protein LY89DRAFT_330528 [Mollisia scopiformis]KUJ08446.1 hypothetical protein LY89DRAFT_330528 [Mollisia scopiformis]